MTGMNLKLSLLLVIITSFMSNVYSPPSTFQHVTDECDWVASSALDTPQRSIRPVYLRCSQGRIEWKYPRGALRVVLRLGTSGKDFKGCVKAGLNFQGAHLYLEGHRTLHLLYSSHDGRHPQLPRCFASRSGQVALYVEAENLSGVETGVVEFNYHLEPRWPWKLTRGEENEQKEEKKLTPDLQADCKPCKDEDLIHLYCTSDFAVRGRMLHVFDNHQLDRTELKVAALRIYKQNAAIFQQKMKTKKHSTSSWSTSWTPSSSSKGHQKVKEPLQQDYHHPPFHQGRDNCSECLTDGGGQWTGVVHFPLVCGVKFGSDEFMFLGRLLLGCPVVMCAPRWEDWFRVWTMAASQGATQCTIP